MDLSSFSRLHYLQSVTPIEELSRFTSFLGGPKIFIKRDDLTGGLAEGGNKVRKLEFVVADALVHNADTLVTGGAVQSNHCRATLAAAVKEGLKCRLILQERVPGSYNPSATGNNLLYHLLGADQIRVIPGSSDIMAEMENVLEELQSDGRRGYLIPVGASNEIGTLGYVACVKEMITQFSEQHLHIDYIICPSGSGGTHAGLLAGVLLEQIETTVIGINVSRNRHEQEELVYQLALRVLDKLNCHQQSLDRRRLRCFDNYVGPGYSIPTAGMIEAVRLLGSLEGILLDPVYTGKAMAGLIDLVRQGYFKKDHRILFMHTGGIPALYAYASDFLPD